MEEILFEELSYSVIGAAQEVHRHLGSDFLEAVYEQALAYELEARKIDYERQAPLREMYKDKCAGNIERTLSSKRRSWSSSKPS